jgi:prepilin-type N-terminal cleavage/methylation domain-containing protein
LGFTLVELLVVIGIIALLISILMPSLQRARDSANTLACLSNQRQLALMLQMYTAENRGVFPMATTCNDGSPHTGMNHTPRNTVTFRDFVIARGANKARMCTGPSGRHWNGGTKTLAPGGWWAGSWGNDFEPNSWITVNARVCPRNDHWIQNAGYINNPPSGAERWRVVKKSTYFRPASRIMATIDGYVPTQNVAVIGATPDENNDNVGEFGYGPERVRFRHGRQMDRVTLSFLDGHAETWEYSSMSEQPPGWGATSSNERHLLSGDMRYLPWGSERTDASGWN